MSTMRVIKKEVKKCTIYRQPTMDLISKVWRALRVQWLNSKGGRNPFAEMIYETLIVKSAHLQFEYEDGKEYIIPDGGVDGKTINSFVRKASSVLSARTLDDKKPINTTDITIQYLHAYLWCVDYERVKKWRFGADKILEDMLVNNLDENFDLFSPSAFFGSGYKIYLSPGFGSSELMQAAFTSDSIYGFEQALQKDEAFELVGAIYFTGTKADIIEKSVYFASDQLELLKSASSGIIENVNTNREQFDTGFVLSNYRSIAFRSKNYSQSPVPEISRDQLVIVYQKICEIGLQEQYGDTQLSHFDFSKQFPFEEFSDRYMNAYCRTEFNFNGFPHSCIIIPFSNAELPALSTICNLRM